MSLSQADWQEAAAYLDRIGAPSAFVLDPTFQKTALEFLQLLLQKNQQVNLTGAKDLETLFWKHLVDSLAILAISDLGVTCDWGCGGGFPGIPLALARKAMGDSTEVFFLDSVGKKVKAVEEFCAALNLAHTRHLHGRGEVFIAGGQLQQVNTVVMRAVAPASRAIEWISPKIPSWLFFLGPNQLDEWKLQNRRIEKMGLALSEEKRFSLPRQLGERVLLRVSKRST